MADIYKPRFGEPCNGCGMCCKLEVCQAGRITLRQAGYFEVSTPCPFIIDQDGRSLCAVVIAEEKAIERGDVQEAIIARGLGIGCGCTMDDRAEAV